MKLAHVIALASLQLPAFAAVGEVTSGLDLARFSAAFLARDSRTLCHTWVAPSGLLFEALAAIPVDDQAAETPVACDASTCLLSIPAADASASQATLSLILTSQPATDGSAPYAASASIAR